MHRDEVIRDILAECDKQGLMLDEQKSYVISTVDHETNGTFKPVKEAYWKNELWRKDNLRYFPFYGRGLVQLTWDYNYRKYSPLVGVDLVKNPDLAMEYPIAVFILVHGFKHGTFTGKKLEDYVRARKVDFRNARRCINGLDRAKHIEHLANQWLRKLPTLKISTYQLQQALNEHGVNPKLVCDGIDGPMTKAAVMEFQEDNGLVQDGIAGHKTLTKLELV